MEAIGLLPEDSAWAYLGGALPRFETLLEAWEAALWEAGQKDKRFRLLTEGEMAALLAFGKSLGSAAGHEELQRHFSAVTLSLSEAEAGLKEIIPQKCRIYRSLGILGGIALVLVIW